MRIVAVKRKKGSFVEQRNATLRGLKKRKKIEEGLANSIKK